MSASPIDRQMYARQYRKATEEFPALAENAGCQTLQELSTLRGDEPYADFGLEDARQDCYTAWFAYKDAKQAEWCAMSPLLCTTQETALQWTLVEVYTIQAMGNGLIAAGHMVANGEFKKLGLGIGQGFAKSVREFFPNASDAFVAAYTPELSPETVAQAWSKPLLDAANIYSIYAMAGSLVELTEAGFNATAKIAPSTLAVTPEGVSLSVAADGGMRLPGYGTPLRIVPKQQFPAVRIPDPSTILRLRPEVLKQLLEATKKRLEGELAYYRPHWDDAAQISGSMRPRLSPAEQAHA